MAALSGGHLNPLISIAFALSGHQHAAQSGDLHLHEETCVSKRECVECYIRIASNDAFRLCAGLYIIAQVGYPAATNCALMMCVLTTKR